MHEEKGDVAGRADEGPGPQKRYDEDAAWAEELLEHLRPTGRDLRRVVAWLAHTVRATVCVLDADGTLLAGDRVPLDDALLTDVVTGRISAAAVEDREHHVRLVAIGHPNPLPTGAGVLAVARTTPFDRRAAEIVTHTAGILELLLKERELTTAGHRLRRVTADLRLAVLQLLMVEETVSARRVAAGLWPGLLDTDTARVYVVEGSPTERDRLAEECLDLTEGQALVVRCPAMDGHVIVVSPAPSAQERLRSLVHGRPRTFLGASVQQSLARTATAYGQAISALAVAHFRPDQAAVYAERTHPERLMDPARLRDWSAEVLRPLDTLAHHTRAELLATTRLGLEFTAVNAAKVLGVSRNTVRARMDRVEALLGADFSDLTVRAAAHLALNTQAAQTSYDRDGTTPRPPDAGRLGDLLAGGALVTWAQDLLGRLDEDGRDLRGTLRAWIAAGANAERAAQELGVHAQTVREHVRGAEPVLERRLLASGTDLYEVVLAHLAVGDLAAPALRRDNRGQPDASVHG
ncbi:helix-turn-helix domain-containing protein [Streptomyces sp. NPDC006739]|uniref:helix-turn-helix domain-containing protein n=1 Tax=Streptomyces sp. NPDC006739 TaxID=3364763 RepID=UPI0036CA8295